MKSLCYLFFNFDTPTRVFLSPMAFPLMKMYKFFSKIVRILQCFVNNANKENMKTQ